MEEGYKKPSYPILLSEENIETKEKKYFYIESNKIAEHINDWIDHMTEDEIKEMRLKLNKRMKLLKK